MIGMMLGFLFGYGLTVVTLALFGDEIYGGIDTLNCWWSTKRRNWRWPWQVERRKHPR